MKDIVNIGLKGYKVFPRNEYTYMNNISQVNVVIGKNNSGKTSLLDVIELIYDSNSSIEAGVDVEEVTFDMPLNNEVANRTIQGYTNVGDWDLKRLQEYFVGRNFAMKLVGKKQVKLVNEKEIPLIQMFRDRAISCICERRNQYKFCKITAERNIVPEVEYEICLKSNGEGATNLIRTFLNDGNYDETIIENELLEALNGIMMPEAEFENIRVQEVMYSGQKYWEVFLQEKGMQRVPLSKTGSGLKTIVLVLLNLLVIPYLKDYKKLKLVYGFEELENNLHPALQRRLFDYLYKFAIENDIILFLTTHSHIAINSFFGKEQASIYHVIKEDGNAKVKSIETHIDKTEILDDLDVKASDILQSNGIIWVEGPSDRIYIKRWLELFTDNKYIEGQHYQFLYYGGRLVSHYTTKQEDEMINIITTNRNAAIVIDSDKRNRQTSINATKKRIVEEFGELEMFSWVTKGKEIENYIPKEALENMLGKTIKRGCGRYEIFPKYIEKMYKGFSAKKVAFANKVKEYITRENAEVLDVKKQVNALYSQIQKWNQ